MIGLAILAIGILIAAIWIVIEIKRLKHKLFAIFLIVLILFFYLSVVVVFRDRDIDYKSIEGVSSASRLYFSWLVSVSGNFMKITSNAVSMDWNNVSEGYSVVEE